MFGTSVPHVSSSGNTEDSNPSKASSILARFAKRKVNMTTRTQVIARARLKADLVASTHITSTDDTDLFQEAYKEVYTLYGENGFHMLETDATLTVSAGVATLPTDFFACINIYKVIGDDYYPLRRLDPNQEAGARSLTDSEAYFYKITRSATNGRSVRLYPAPSSGTYILHYVPECDTPGASDTLVTVGNSDTVLVCLLARKFLQKQDEQNSSLDEECRRLFDDVKRQAEIVEMTQTYRVQDVRKRYYLDSFKFNYFPDGD